jgi:hypothetical protein
MNKKALLTIAGFIIIAAGGAALLFFGPFTNQKKQERRRTRIIIPQELDTGRDSDSAGRMVPEDSVNTKVAMAEGDLIIDLLTQDIDGDPAEEQIVAFRSLLEMDSPVYLSFIDYDETTGEYRRIWTAPTAAVRPGTVSLYTQDLIGDRSVCIILTGMDNQDNHTMTIFRRNPRRETEPPFVKIAELKIDGSISVQETERSQAYHQGIAKDKSFTIAAYGHDFRSGNILDQVEIIYAFNTESGVYGQSAVTRIPGSQIEQRRLKELLDGEKSVFENFISDLWYYAGPQGAAGGRLYIYFDPRSREIIFYGDETQQVFTWQNSNPTRYGIYISSQNISVTTLRRFLDIELESLDSIRIRVFEDVRLKIGAGTSWDGSYRRAGAGSQTISQNSNAVSPYIDALYDSSLGRLRFYPDGGYELSSGGALRKGRYVFFRINGQDFLELRHTPPAGPRTVDDPEAKSKNDARLIYRIDPVRKTGAESPARGSLNLSRIRLGATGVQDLHEGMITLSPAGE